MYPYAAPHTAKFHTPITLGIRHRGKPLVSEVQKSVRCGFDSHRPLHFLLSGVSLRCPRTRASLMSSSHSFDAATTGLWRPNVHSSLIDSVHGARRWSSFPWSLPSATDAEAAGDECQLKGTTDYFQARVRSSSNAATIN
jgi:hypothetical protein